RREEARAIEEVIVALAAAVDRAHRDRVERACAIALEKGRLRPPAVAERPYDELVVDILELVHDERAGERRHTLERAIGRRLEQHRERARSGAEGGEARREERALRPR